MRRRRNVGPHQKIQVVQLEDPRAFQETESVQRNAWGIPPNESVIPFHTLIAAQHHGGLVLGAYQDRRMIGCLFGISAIRNNDPQLYHYSHITCVLRRHQGTGVGYLLKKRQREILRQRGINLVTWTFDPLQTGNAHFNIRKLGAIIREYHRDLYGPMPDSLNRGMISDRFEAEWWINSTRVRKALTGRQRHENTKTEEDAKVNQTAPYRSSSLRQPVRLRLSLDQKQLFFEIPYSIRMVKRESLDLARDWTLHLRRGFENYFRRGYVVTDILLENQGSDPRAYYLLERGFSPKKS